MKSNQLLSASVVAFALCVGCSSSTMSFHPIEPRATQSIVKIAVDESVVGRAGQGKESTRNSGINLDVFRAKVMLATGIRFVEASPDATIQISFGNNTFHSFLGMFNKHWEQYYTMRITENSGRIIYVTEGILVGDSPYEQALELNRLFVEQVIPVIQGKGVALNMGPLVATL